MSWELRRGLLEGDPTRLLRGLLDMVPEARDPHVSSGRGRFVDVVLDRPVGAESYTYEVPAELAPDIHIGSKVRVPLRTKSAKGWVTGFRATADVDGVRIVGRVLGGMPVFGRVELELARWIAWYYLAPLWKVLARLDSPTLPPPGPPFPGPIGDRVLDCVLVEHPPLREPTAELIDAIGQTLSSGKSVLVAAAQPRSGAAAAIRGEFREVIDFSDSAGRAGRALAWRRAATGETTLTIGGRSAVLAPCRNLGLVVVVDESHPSLKEEATPCWSGREVGVVRAFLSGARSLITSASPSQEARSWATSYRATGGSRGGGWPHVLAADRSEEPPGLGPVGEMATTWARRVIGEGGRVLFFVNRAGESRAIRCATCNYLRICDSCGGILKSEADPAGLIACEKCGAATESACPRCFGTKMRKVGAGTGMVAKAVGTLFPGTSLARADRQSKHEDDSSAVRDARIVVGTEAAFWRAGKVDLVVVVDADSMLKATDAFARWRSFVLFARAAAMIEPAVARAPYRGVLIQTYSVADPTLQAMLHRDPVAALATQLSDVEGAGLPPFTRAALVDGRGDAAKTVAEIAEELKRVVPAAARVMGPRVGKDATTFVLLADPRSCWHLLAETVERRRRRGGRIRVEVDPLRL